MKCILLSIVIGTADITYLAYKNMKLKKNKMMKLFHNTGYVLEKNKKENIFDKSYEHNFFDDKINLKLSLLTTKSFFFILNLF